MYTWIVTVVPPRAFGLRKSIAANSSASMIRESPIWISAWPTDPPGPGMRMISFAPNAFL
ncbi:hypothetical protein D3C83_286570 [compost metagenome]